MMNSFGNWAQLIALVLAIGAAFWLGFAWRKARPDRRRQNLRGLSQAGSETQSIALALRRLASGPASPQPKELQALALQLLDVSDHLEELSTDDRPRKLVDERVPLHSLVEQAVAVANAQLGTAARPCTLDESLGAVALRADGRAMRGAMVQVLVRAARLTRPQDPIDIRFTRIGSLAAIVIEDEGVGLAAEDLQSAAPTARTRGLNFGLSLARKLLHAHGGDLVFETAAGIGTRAWLTLPEERVLTVQTAQA